MSAPAFLRFLAAIAPVLYELFLYVTGASAASDPEREKQIAMDLVRAAKDAQARAEITGP